MDPNIEARETAERALARLLELKWLSRRQASPTWWRSLARYECRLVRSLHRTRFVSRHGWRSERLRGRSKATIRGLRTWLDFPAPSYRYDKALARSHRSLGQDSRFGEELKERTIEALQRALEDLGTGGGYRLQAGRYALPLGKSP